MNSTQVNFKPVKVQIAGTSIMARDALTDEEVELQNGARYLSSSVARIEEQEVVLVSPMGGRFTDFKIAHWLPREYFVDCEGEKPTTRSKKSVGLEEEDISSLLDKDYKEHLWNAKFDAVVMTAMVTSTIFAIIMILFGGKV